MLSGIYKITNTVNGKFYIGSSRDVKHRWTEHKSELNGKYHNNPRLQNAWLKYGETVFSFEVVEQVSEFDLLTREQYWIDQTQCLKKTIGYNICPFAAAPMKGRTASLKTRAKQSASHVGRKRQFKNKEQWRANIKKSWETRRLTPVSASTRKKQSRVRKGKKRSIKTRNKISSSLRGRIPSPAQVANITRYNEQRSNLKNQPPPLVAVLPFQ